MSFVNVGVVGASAAIAAAGTSITTPITHWVSCLMFKLPLVGILRSNPTLRILLRKYWSSSTGSRRHLRQIRHWPAPGGDTRPVR